MLFMYYIWVNQDVIVDKMRIKVCVMSAPLMCNVRPQEDIIFLTNLKILKLEMKQAILTGLIQYQRYLLSK